MKELIIRRRVYPCCIALFFGTTAGCDASVGIAGRYRVSSSPSCFTDSELFIENQEEGSLIFQGVTLTHDGSSYDGVSATTACSLMDHPSYLMYAEAHVSQTNADGVHVVFATAESSTDAAGCTQDAALALASHANRCEFEATLSKSAPLVTDVSPGVMSPSDCSTKKLRIDGRFDEGVRVGLERTDIFANSNCSGTTGFPVNQTSACELVIVAASSTTIQALLWPRIACAATGTLQLVVQNPDGQNAFVKVEVQ